MSELLRPKSITLHCPDGTQITAKGEDLTNDDLDYFWSLMSAWARSLEAQNE